MKITLVLVPFLLPLAFRSMYVSSTDDRFIKRYALMKVRYVFRCLKVLNDHSAIAVENPIIHNDLMYESCFGPEVVKEVRKEMRIAAAKCNGMMPPTHSSKAGTNSLKNPITLIIQPNRQQAENLYSSEHLKSQPSANMDLNKLQQAIFAGFNKNMPHTAYSNNIGQNTGSSYAHTRPWMFPAPGNAYSYSHMVGTYPPVQTGNFAFVPAMMSPPNSPFFQSTFFSPFYGVGRSSRDLDVKGQLESLAVRVSGRMKNATCIMQELGYLNENMEPDYENIQNRIKRLSVAEELKTEMLDGVEYCKQFSLCVPNDNKDKFSKDMVKPMFFFKCYKHKKMEACILKDIKDRYTSDNTDENFISLDRNDRSNHQLNSKDLTELALYEFLYGTDNLDVDEI